MPMPGQTGRLMSAQELDSELRRLLDMAPLFQKDSQAPPPLIDKFNTLVHNAYHSLNNSYAVDKLKVMSSPITTWGTLEYGILRTLRILNRGNPAPAPINCSTKIIGPIDFFLRTQKPTRQATEEDERGPNLKRVDVNLIWCQLACEGENTNVRKLKRELLFLESAIDKYFSEKGFFSRENERQRQVRSLQLSVKLMLREVSFAEKFDHLRKYSDGDLKINYPDSDLENLQVDVKIIAADPILPSYAKQAFQQGRPSASAQQSRSGGTALADVMAEGVDTVSQAYDVFDTTRSLLAFVGLA